MNKVKAIILGYGSRGKSYSQYAVDHPEDFKGNIEFKNVKFGYDKDKVIIKDFSLKVKAGEKIAIVGPTGAGKTTIINLLMRFYDAVSGEIRVDGKPIESLKRASLRKAYTMVLQDTWLFHGTVFENIAYGKENATEEEVIRAAKAARIHSYIEHLPDGYQTVLSDDGINISKGQKQLITIARAMMKNASVVILDEATAYADPENEAIVQKAIDKLVQGKTLIVIAHRLSTIKNADKIVVMESGRVLAEGKQQELLDTCPLYARMWHDHIAATEVA